MDGDFESLACLQVEGIVKRLRVEKHGEAVCLANLRPFHHCPVVFSENLPPVRHFVDFLVESNLWLDDRADAVVGSKVRIEVGEVSETC